MVYIVFIVFLIMLIFTIYRKYWLVATYLVGIYTFMLFFAAKIARTGNLMTQSSTGFDYVGPSILFMVLLITCLTPYFKEPPSIIKNNSNECVHRLCVIGYSVSILLVVGMVLLAPYIINSFSYGLAEVRREMYMGENIAANFTIAGHIGHSILRWLGWLGYINVIIFFYMTAYIRGKALLKLLLFISSFAAIWLGLLIGGRTNVIYWLMFFLYNICIFYNEFNFKTKNIIVIFLTLAAVVLYVYFSYMTNARADMYYMIYSNSTEFLEAYAGQPYHGFLYYFDNCKWHPYSLNRIIPLTASLFTGRFDLRDYRNLIEAHTGVNVSGFSTFLGDIYVDVGIVGLILFCIVVRMITQKVTKPIEYDLTKLLYLGIVVQIPLMGVFFHSFWREEISASIIISLIIARYLDVNKKGIKFVLGKKRVI